MIRHMLRRRTGSATATVTATEMSALQPIRGTEALILPRFGFHRIDERGPKTKSRHSRLTEWEGRSRPSALPSLRAEDHPFASEALDQRGQTLRPMKKTLCQLEKTRGQVEKALRQMKKALCQLEKAL
jgi:hypothetical protein